MDHMPAGESAIAQGREPAVPFSPFRDERGAPKSLADVTYADLSQLQDLDEGYALEFKRTFGQSVRRKIPKIVASFSNSSGGWLVIGISDGDKELCPIPREAFDFSQAIGELCRRHVSPTPRFDMRFLPNPTNPSEGVLVVRVEEGDFPPYVADGVVEVREGSTSGPAVGSALVELYGKATRRRAEVSDFCRRTVYYPESLALFDLYLFHMGTQGPDLSGRAAANERAAAMHEAFAHQGMDCHVQHAHDSLIFRATMPAGPADPHSAIELFGDESIKLTVPAVLLSGEQRVRALEVISAAMGVEEFSGSQSAVLMSAPETLARVTRMASLLDRYTRERGALWRDYAVAYELEGMAGALLWSDEPIYLGYAQRRGILFCGTTDCRSRVRYLDDGDHDSFRARQFAGSHFFEACGLPLGSNDAEDNALVDALLKNG